MMVRLMINSKLSIAVSLIFYFDDDMVGFASHTAFKQRNVAADERYVVAAGHFERQK